MKTVKPLEQMTTTELQDRDSYIGNRLDGIKFTIDQANGFAQEWRDERREVRAELERRHAAEMSSLDDDSETFPPSREEILKRGPGPRVKIPSKKMFC